MKTVLQALASAYLRECVDGYGQGLDIWSWEQSCQSHGVPPSRAMGEGRTLPATLSRSGDWGLLATMSWGWCLFPEAWGIPMGKRLAEVAWGCHGEDEVLKLLPLTYIMMMVPVAGWIPWEPTWGGDECAGRFNREHSWNQHQWEEQDWSWIGQKKKWNLDKDLAQSPQEVLKLEQPSRVVLEEIGLCTSVLINHWFGLLLGKISHHRHQCLGEDALHF